MKDHGDHWDEPARCGRCGQERSTHDDGECETVTRIYKKPAVKAETQPAHTPTPWSVDAMGYIRGPNSENILENHANAEFTVRAVNAHEELVEAIQWALAGEYVTQDGQRVPMVVGETRAMLERALTKAVEK